MRIYISNQNGLISKEKIEESIENLFSKYKKDISIDIMPALGTHMSINTEERVKMQQGMIVWMQI